MGDGNAIAHLALLVWLPLSIAVASLVPPVRAFLIIVIGGTLLLPERLAFFGCPRPLWRRLRTINIIERCFVDVRLGTKQ
jgi:hypothetical protein